jgi:hypothetical protein
MIFRRGHGRHTCGEALLLALLLEFRLTFSLDTCGSFFYCVCALRKVRLWLSYNSKEEFVVEEGL